MALPDEKCDLYLRHIDDILKSSDLLTISAKQIRRQLDAKVDHDIAPYKEAINGLIMQRFDHFQELNAGPDKPAPSANGTSNGHVKSDSVSSRPSKRPSPDDGSDNTDAPSEKASKKSQDSDAAYAARLQAELNSADRPTRGGGPRKSKANSSAKRTPKKKSAAKVKSDDDSDIGSGSDAEVKPKRTGAFHKLMGLSEPLQKLTGETALSRPQTVKRIWDYVKANELQNPNDKRMIMCDDMLQAVFKQSTVTMFNMNKILSKNLYPLDE